MRYITRSGITLPKGDVTIVSPDYLRVSSRWVNGKKDRNVIVKIYVPVEEGYRTVAGSFSPRRLAAYARAEAERKFRPWLGSYPKRAGQRQVREVISWRGKATEYVYVFEKAH